MINLNLLQKLKMDRVKRAIEYLGVTLLLILILNWLVGFGFSWITVFGMIITTLIYYLLFQDELSYLYYIILLRILSAILKVIGGKD